LSVVDRIAAIEKRLRVMQQATAGTTTANGGVPLGTGFPAPVGTTAAVGSSPTCAHADHVHTGTLAASLQDVTISGPANTQILRYNGSAWANAPNTLASDTDTAISSPAANQALVYTGSAWQNSSVLPIGMYSRYQSTTSSAAFGAYTALAWGSPAEGTGAGLTLTGGTAFTLASGIWRISCCVLANSASGGFCLQFGDNASHGSIVNWYGQTGAPVICGQACVEMSTEIRSTGTSVFVVYVTPNSATATLSVGSTLPRLTFEWQPL